MLDSLPCSFTYIFFLTKQKKNKNILIEKKPQNMPIILNKTLFSLFRTKNYICNRLKDMAIVQVKIFRYIYYNFIFSKHFKIIAGK